MKHISNQLQLKMIWKCVESLIIYLSFLNVSAFHCKVATPSWERTTLQPSHHLCIKAVNAIKTVLNTFQSYMTLAPVKYYPSMQGGSAQKGFLFQVSGICKSMDFTNWGYNTEMENLSFTGYLKAHHPRLHMRCYWGEISFVSAWTWKIYYKQFNSKQIWIQLPVFSLRFTNPK